MSKELISFVIPSYNEERYIANTLNKIKECVPAELPYEIILVDHGSTDRTVDIASEYGLDIYHMTDTTIAGLRNYGVSKSGGDVLIFLDADIELTQAWKESILPVIECIRKGERILTGSWYSVPEKATWIETVWFKPLQNLENTHINSGHMIISMELFNSIGGFSEHLETGEDYDISMKAKASGIKIIDNKELVVIHHGYPKDILNFMKREYWHGKGDAVDISTLLKSKVAMLSLILLLAHVTFLLSLLFAEGPVLSLCSLAVILAIPITSSVVKYRGETGKTILGNAILYYFYFLARAMSSLNIFTMPKIIKRQR